MYNCVLEMRRSSRCLRLIVAVAAMSTWWQVAISDPHTNLLARGCSSNSPKTSVSEFLNNRNSTFIELRRKLAAAVENKFFATANHTAESPQQPVYGMAQCRNYMSNADCLACYDAAVLELNSRCYNDTGARIYYDGCYLRYEDYDFYEKATESGVSCSSQSLGVDMEFGRARDRLVGDLARAVAAAPNEARFAANERVVSKDRNLTVYGVVQCVETVSPNNCQVCLAAALELLQVCRSTSDGVIWDPACFVRYSNTPFFSDDFNTDISIEGSKTKAIIVGVSVGVAGLFVISFSLLWYKFSRQLKNALITNLLRALELQNPNRYSYNDLKAATNGFSEANKLGQGAFGVVYKANLENGSVVAVKKLDMSNRGAKEDYETEVRLISNVHHRNLVRLLGCCTKGSELLLVLEYMENGSLDRFLYGNKRGSLNWKQRFDMIFGTAKGLAYLHEHYFSTMIHRDIKPANILVDNQFQPKISDFGLAKLLPENQTHLSTGGFAGTLGYTAPEYALGGHLSERVDVYSFGVVVLEIISGRRSNDMNLGTHSDYLLKNAWQLYEGDRHEELVDEALEASGEEAQDVKKMVEIALLCTQSPPSLRPTMSQILSMLTQHRLSETRPPQRPNYIYSLDSSNHTANASFATAPAHYL